jgi:hypothetical protein
MKKLIFAVILMFVGFTTLFAQEAKTKLKTKSVLYGYNFELFKVDTLVNNQLVGSAYELKGTNDKYPTDTKLFPIQSGTVDDLKLLVDSALNFIAQSVGGQNIMCGKVQFVIPTASSSNSIVVFVTGYDFLHSFTRNHLLQIQKALDKLRTK